MDDKPLLKETCSGSSGRFSILGVSNHTLIGMDETIGTSKISCED